MINTASVAKVATIFWGVISPIAFLVNLSECTLKATHWQYYGDLAVFFMIICSMFFSATLTHETSTEQVDARTLFSMVIALF